MGARESEKDLCNLLGCVFYAWALTFYPPPPPSLFGESSEQIFRKQFHMFSRNLSSNVYDTWYQTLVVETKGVVFTMCAMVLLWLSECITDVDGSCLNSLPYFFFVLFVFSHALWALGGRCLLPSETLLLFQLTPEGRPGMWCLPPVWNLRAVFWFHFAISSLVLLPSPVTLSVLSFSACWSILLSFFKKNLRYFSLRDRLFCMAPV